MSLQKSFWWLMGWGWWNLTLRPHIYIHKWSTVWWNCRVKVSFINKDSGSCGHKTRKPKNICRCKLFSSLVKQLRDSLCDFSAVMKIFSVCGSESAVLCLLHVRSRRFIPGCMSCRSAYGKKAAPTSDSRLPLNMYVSSTDGLHEHSRAHSHICTWGRRTNA